MADEYCLIKSLPYSVNQQYHIFNIMNKFAIIILEKQKSKESSIVDMWNSCKVSYDLTITDLFILRNKDQDEAHFRLTCASFNAFSHLQAVFHIRLGQYVSGGWHSGWNDWRRSDPIKIILIGETDMDYIIQFLYIESFGNGEYSGYNKQLHTISITKKPASNDISSIIRHKTDDIGYKEMGFCLGSYKEPLLEVVDKEERLVQYETKKEVHKSGHLHSAFSVFLYDHVKRAVLIQRRSLKKYHSGGLWSNSCCSHKYHDETWEESVARCLRDELNLQETDVGSHIQHLGMFYYFSDYGDNKEHEIDHVYIYTPDVEMCSQINPNPNEIMDVKWMTIEEIDMALKTTPQSFSSWFSKAYSFFRDAVLESYS